MEIQNDLREYGYMADISLSSRCDQIKDYLDEKLGSTSKITDTIKETIIDSMSTYDEKFSYTNTHIEDAKNEIVNVIDCHGSGSGCCCQLATKDDVNNAIEKINEHTDHKFDEINFIQQFSDLNQQVKEINNKIGQ